MEQKPRRRLWVEGNPSQVFLAIFITALIVWNLWMPTARRYFSARNRSDDPPNLDFFAYYLAGRAYQLSLNPYEEHRDIVPEIVVIEGSAWQGKFVYPPTFLPLYSLLSQLEYGFARKLWVLAALGLHSITLLLLTLSSRKQIANRVLLLGLVLTFTSHPLLFHIRQGQVDLFVSSLITLCIISYLQRRRVLSAFTLAVAFLIKVNPIFFLITFLFFFKDLKYLWSFALSTLILVMASLIIIPAGLYPEYFLDVLPSVAEGSSYVYNQSVFRLFHSWQMNIGSDLSSWMPFAVGQMNGLLTGLFMAILSVFFLYLGRRKYRAPELSWGEHYADDMVYIVFFMNMLVTLLFSSRSWHMVFVWTILSMARLMAGFLEYARGWFIILIGFSFALMNAVIYEDPWLDSLNMIGGLSALILLTIFLLHRTRVIRGSTKSLAFTQSEISE